MTDGELQAIEARVNAATPGPWQRWRSGDLSTITVQMAHKDGSQDGVGICFSDEDAAFIVSAREDVPKLIAEIRRLKTQP